MVEKFRAQAAAAAAATPRHFHIASSSEPVWRYSKWREDFRQGLGFASFGKSQFSSACLVAAPSKPRQQCSFAVTAGGVMFRPEERGPSMQVSGLWAAAQVLTLQAQRGFVGRLAKRQKTTAGVKVNGGKLLGAESQCHSEEDERELWSTRLGVREGTRAQSPKRNGDRTRVDDIPLSELVKIQELKFSGDIWEGDRGPEVLDLQRALYWFGFLPTQTCLTAYFGTETKEALQQFQTLHGVPNTGVWGPASRQALWKRLCAESHEGASQVQRNMQPVASFTDNLSGLKAAGEKQVGICVSELLHLMSAPCLVSSVSSAPQWKHIPRNASMVALLFAVVVGLLGLGYSVIAMFQVQHGQPVRRRVMRAHWRDGVRGGGHLKTKKQLHMFPGLGCPVHREKELKCPSHQLHAKSRPGEVDATGQTDRLIIYDGQVILGNSPQCYSALRNRPTWLSGSSTARLQASSKSKRPSIPVANAAEQVPTKQVILRDRVEKLRKAVKAAEQNRQTAMHCLAEERQRSLELQVKISRQKEAAVAMEEEVRVLKESHDALLAVLRKKYSSSVAARAAAALLYQDWDTSSDKKSIRNVASAF